MKCYNRRKKYIYELTQKNCFTEVEQRDGMDNLEIIRLISDLIYYRIENANFTGIFSPYCIKYA